MKNSQHLINTPIGHKMNYNGKLYESLSADHFGAKGCMSCDLFEIGFGCTGKGVVCYSPPRIYKETKPVEDIDFSVDNDTPTWLIILFVIILVVITWPVLLGMWIMDRKSFKQIYKK